MIPYTQTTHTTPSGYVTDKHMIAPRELPLLLHFHRLSFVNSHIDELFLHSYTATIMNILHSTLSTWRDRLAPVSRTSTFRSTGQITPEEFVLAGDYLVYKFPTWSWADASSEAKRVSYLPAGKQFLVTRGVPCHRRLNDNFAGDAGQDDEIVRDMLSGGTEEQEGAAGGDEDGWLRTGGGRDLAGDQAANIRDVRTLNESGNLGEQEDEDEIPDMEDDDDDDEAIIREPAGGSGTTQ